jgi:hypothetical protein
MEEVCIGSQGPQWTVVFENKKKKKKKKKRKKEEEDETKFTS